MCVYVSGELCVGFVSTSDISKLLSWILTGESEWKRKTRGERVRKRIPMTVKGWWFVCGGEGVPTLQAMQKRIIIARYYVSFRVLYSAILIETVFSASPLLRSPPPPITPFHLRSQNKTPIVIHTEFHYTHPAI